MASLTVCISQFWFLTTDGVLFNGIGQLNGVFLDSGFKIQSGLWLSLHCLVALVGCQCTNVGQVEIVCPLLLQVKLEFFCAEFSPVLLTVHMFLTLLG